MTIRVAFNCSRLSLTMAWVRLSRALVASSKYIILGLLTMALAIKSPSAFALRTGWYPLH